MASSKDIFEADVFAANMFASGIWRGVGVDVVAIFAPYDAVYIEKESVQADAQVDYPAVIADALVQQYDERVR